VLHPPPAATGALHKIGEVAERVGLSLRTVRYYEEVGLVSPATRSEGGFRLYSEEQIGRLRLITQMKPLGFSLEQMGDVLDARDRLLDPDATSSHRAAARRDLAELGRYAQERCAKLRQHLAGGETLAVELARLSRTDKPLS
jgi:DNA-binding transcriptional MerR regulator